MSAVVLLPIVTLVLVRRVRLLRWQNTEDWPATWAADDTVPTFWLEPDWNAFLREIRSSVASASVTHLGVAALAGGSSVTAGLLLAVAVAVPAWRWPMADRAGRKSGWGWEAAVALALILVSLNWIARREEGGPPATRPPLVSDATAARYGKDLSGVILTLPIKPQEKLLAPAPVNLLGRAAAAARPVRIDFDGEYWYFQAPDRRPRQDARVVRGDPVKAKIRSTNAIPIQMEAHQRLPEQTSIDPYREIVVTIRDADDLPGLIRISLLLQGEKGTLPLLLGTRVLEASRTRHGYESRPAVEEDLRFAVTPAVSGKHWAELIVRVEPERARAQAAAHLTVIAFLLRP